MSPMNFKFEQPVTPLTQNFHSKLPTRKLWEKENVPQEHYRESWSKYRCTDRENWDLIGSPQFLDFTNISDAGDSFFDNTVIMSTPKPQTENEDDTVVEDVTLVNSLHDFSLANVKSEMIQQENINHKFNTEENKEEYVVHTVRPKLEPKVKQEKRIKVEKLQCTMVTPFSFDLREKYRQERKQERVLSKKILEEENKPKVFRANPVPKFVKSRLVSTSKSTNVEQAGKANLLENPVKKNIEVWKRKPFQPSTIKRVSERPKTPPLSTAIRAKERKRFDDALKEKERLKEEMRQMGLLIKKKQEEEEIARMRKQTVHKAQPIRKYKSGLPPIQKRPLTDPITPIPLKRRRRV